MINAHYFINGEVIDMWFDTPHEAINALANRYLDIMHKSPECVFMSYEVYEGMLQDIPFRNPQASSILRFYTISGAIDVKPVRDPKGRFIYVGDEQGYKNCLIDKEFEKIFFGVEDAD